MRVLGGFFIHDREDKHHGDVEIRGIVAMPFSLAARIAPERGGFAAASVGDGGLSEFHFGGKLTRELPQSQMGSWLDL